MMKNTNQGFTLIELFIVVAIVGILLNSAVSGFSKLITSNKVSAHLNRLSGLLNLARQTAISKNTVVTLCPKNITQDGCGSNWDDGLILFIDSNFNRNIDNSDTVISQTENLPNDHHLTWRAFQNKKYLQFNGNGFTRYQNGTFRYCVNNAGNKFNRALILNISGRVKVSQDIDNDGIHEDADDKPILCN